MKKFSSILFLMLLVQCSLLGQTKNEGAFRIRKVQFPEKALNFIDTKLNDATKIRFYKEIDSLLVNYNVKFKKDRLRYSIGFDADGKIEDIKFAIKEIDVPKDSFKKITVFLQKKFKKYRIREMRQQYTLVNNNTEKTLENAFQNILLPSLNYELLIVGKKDKKYIRYEVIFDALGNFINLRKSLPPNYDHILY